MKENVIFEIRTQTNVKMNYCPFYWELRSDLKITFNNKTFKVPKKFKTDFASIPKFLWNIFSPTDERYGKAAVVHDYLYSEGYFEREICDKIFLEAMGVLGAPTYLKYLFYWNVRLFGKSYYK